MPASLLGVPARLIDRVVAQRIHAVSKKPYDAPAHFQHHRTPVRENRAPILTEQKSP
jgi:hypothetical protein